MSRGNGKPGGLIAVDIWLVRECCTHPHHAFRPHNLPFSNSPHYEELRGDSGSNFHAINFFRSRNEQLGNELLIESSCYKYKFFTKRTTHDDHFVRPGGKARLKMRTRSKHPVCPRQGYISPIFINERINYLNFLDSIWISRLFYEFSFKENSARGECVDYFTMLHTPRSLL